MRQLIPTLVGSLFFIHTGGFYIYVGVFDSSRLNHFKMRFSVSHSSLWPVGFHAL